MLASKLFHSCHLRLRCLRSHCHLPTLYVKTHHNIRCYILNVVIVIVIQVIHLGWQPADHGEQTKQVCANKALPLIVVILLLVCVWLLPHLGNPFACTETLKNNQSRRKKPTRKGKRERKKNEKEKVSQSSKKSKSKSKRRK